LRNFDPSNLLAMSFWYQASSVSGFATAANSSKAFRPSRWAISANVAFSASDNNNLPLIWALRMRFSAARYSFLVYGSGDVSKHALGAPRAIKAMAAKLARLVYRMLRYGMKYVDQGAAVYELKHRELQVHQLKWKAAQLGYKVTLLPAA
jgi:hypothetical protein